MARLPRLRLSLIPRPHPARHALQSTASDPAHQIYDCSDHQCLRYRVRDLFICAKYLFVEATASPHNMGPTAHLLRMMNEPVTLRFGGGHPGPAWVLFVYPPSPKTLKTPFPLKLPSSLSHLLS